jgi:uncharacterized membrane protein
MRKIHLVPFALVGAFFLACASGPKEGAGNGAVSPPSTPAAVEGRVVTLAEFDQIQTGMTYEQVRDLIGSDGTVSSEVNIGGTQSKTYTWEGPRVDFMSGSAIVIFQDGKVSSKSQFKLV